jgi:hypothetical protein
MDTNPDNDPDACIDSGFALIVFTNASPSSGKMFYAPPLLGEEPFEARSKKAE